MKPPIQGVTEAGNLYRRLVVAEIANDPQRTFSLAPAGSSFRRVPHPIDGGVALHVGGMTVEALPNRPRARHVRHIVTKNLFELQFGAVTLLSMKAPIKKIKRKRDPGMSFGELVQRLWQPESEEPKPKARRATKKQSAGTPARIPKK